MGPHPLQKEAAVFPEGWDEKVHAHIGHRLGQQRGQGGTQRPPEGNQQQIQNQITQAAQQNSRTQGRLNSDYASQLAAKVQELKENQRKEWNSNYLTAISSAMGQQTTGSQQTAGSQTSIGSQQTTGSQQTLGTSETTGESSTESSGTSVSTTSRGGGGSRKKAATTTVNVRQVNGRYSPNNTSKIR